MPKALEAKLKKQGRKKGLKNERLSAYIYGTMRETEWKPERERLSKVVYG